jgi:hypothetical protein
MAKRRHRFVWSDLGLSSPADADRESTTATVERNDTTADVKDAALARALDVDEKVEDETPARREGLSPAADAEPEWRERFSSPEELWVAYRNEQQVRGRLANELGKARALIHELDEELFAYEQITRSQIELGKSRAVLGAGGGRRTTAPVLGLLAGAGARFEGPTELREEIPSPPAGDDAPAAPESPEAASD